MKLPKPITYHNNSSSIKIIFKRGQFETEKGVFNITSENKDNIQRIVDTVIQEKINRVIEIKERLNITKVTKKRIPDGYMTIAPPSEGFKIKLNEELGVLDKTITELKNLDLGYVIDKFKNP